MEIKFKLGRDKNRNETDPHSMASLINQNKIIY